MTVAPSRCSRATVRRRSSRAPIAATLRYTSSSVSAAPWAQPTTAGSCTAAITTTWLRAISPSRHARLLFSDIMARCGSERELNLQEALQLSSDRIDRGYRDEPAFVELVEERWIAPGDEGGVKILL